MEWTREDHLAASREGWDMFESYGSDNGPYQIQSFDDPDEWEGVGLYPFDGDTDAWEHVWKLAELGSTLHVKALEFLKVHNPLEHTHIVNHINAAKTAEVNS